MKYKFSNKLLIKKVKILIPFMLVYFILSSILVMNKLGFKLEKLHYVIIHVVFTSVIIILIIYFINKRQSTYYVEINENIITLNSDIYITMRLDENTKVRIKKNKKENIITGLCIKNNFFEINLQQYEKLDEIFQKISPYLNEQNIDNCKSKNNKTESKAIFLSCLISTMVFVSGFIIDIIFVDNITNLGPFFSMLFMVIYELSGYFFDFPIYCKGWESKKDKIISAGTWFVLFIILQIRLYYS